MQIVIAWAEQTKLVPTGRHVMRDLNWFPEFKTDWEGKACMWLNKGTESDLAKAKAWAETEGKSVYTFPCNERKPLDRARQLAVTNAS